MKNGEISVPKFKRAKRHSSESVFVFGFSNKSNKTPVINPLYTKFYTNMQATFFNLFYVEQNLSSETQYSKKCICQKLDIWHMICPYYVTRIVYRYAENE